MWDSRTFRCQQKKNCMKKWNVGEAGRALWCISLIYYLPDFQTLILSTLEESPFPFPPSPISCSTCDIGAGLSVFSIDYHIFRALLGGDPCRFYFFHNWCFISWTHGICCAKTKLPSILSFSSLNQTSWYCMTLPGSFLPVFEMSAFEWGHKCLPKRQFPLTAA